MQADSLHKIWWLWVPAVFIALQMGLELFLPSRTLAVLHSEGGPHETVQAILVFAGFIVAVRTLFEMNKKENVWLTSWVGLAALCCFYVAGEEISWGQHVLDWSTPEFWAGVNDQGETNLHNVSSWLDQKPRLILLIGVALGGLVIPFFQRLKSKWVPARFNIIYPPHILALTGFLAIAVNLIDKVDEALATLVIFERASEVEELYLFYFVLLYLVILRRRVLNI